MEDQQELVREDDYNVNKDLIPTIWINERRGLKKELISFEFESMNKSNELAKCLVEFSVVENPGSHLSKYLSNENMESEVWIEMTSANTPVDCYVEEFIQEMLVGETSKCYITTKSGVVSFILTLKKIKFNGEFYEKSAEQMFNLAKKYNSHRRTTKH